MLRILLIGCTCLILSGCVGVNVDRLPDETEFRDLASVSDICGTFRNQGTSQSGEWNPLLTDTFFPEGTFTEPPGEIRISNSKPSVLTVEALSQGTVLGACDLVPGQDFELGDGGLKLKRKLGELILNETGAGVGKESAVIRLTGTGNAVLTQKSGGVGLMLFIVPMAMGESQDAVFERIVEGD